MHVLASVLLLFTLLIQPAASLTIDAAFDRATAYPGETTTLTVTVSYMEAATVTIDTSVPNYLDIRQVEAPAKCSIIVPTQIRGTQNVRCIVPVTPEAPTQVRITVQLSQDLTPGAIRVPTRATDAGGAVVKSEGTIMALTRQLLPLIWC